MKSRKIAAVLLIAGGAGLLLSGLAREGRAIMCDWHGPYYPAICEAAHQVPPGGLEPELDTSCVDLEGMCVPPEGGSCGNLEGYSTPASGKCKHLASYGNNYGCIENMYSTIIALEYHESFCGWWDGTCDCWWLIGGQDARYIEICDCFLTTE